MRARMALYLSQTVVELREVSLRNKPQTMIEISPKGTVPVLLLDDGSVIDESLEIINWCIKRNPSLFKDRLNKDQELFTEDIIKIFDKEFKFHLDRYKYSSRYKNVDETSHRNSCISILKNLDKEIKNTSYFFSNNPHKIDLCILPFIRQFRIANPNWFDNHEEIPRIQKWLSSFLESYLLKEVMVSYEVWKKNKPITIFPISQ